MEGQSPGAAAFGEARLSLHGKRPAAHTHTHTVDACPARAMTALVAAPMGEVLAGTTRFGLCLAGGGQHWCATALSLAEAHLRWRPQSSGGSSMHDIINGAGSGCGDVIAVWAGTVFVGLPCIVGGIRGQSRPAIPWRATVLGQRPQHHPGADRPPET